MVTFIFQRLTPRQVRFIPATQIQGNGSGGYSHKPLREWEGSRVNRRVMAALSTAMKGLPVRDGLLKAAFEKAEKLDPDLFTYVTFSPRQSNGRPPMLTIKE